MNQEQYSKREFDLIFHEMNEKLDALIVQTKKTNGTVADLKVWRGYITGAVSVIIIVGLPVLGFLGWQEINTSNQVAAVEAATHTSTFTHTTTNITP